MEPSDLHSQHRDAPRGLSGAFQRIKDAFSIWFLRNSIQHKAVERLDGGGKHMRSGSADMQGNDANTNAVVPAGVHGLNNAAANEYVPRSVWQPGVVKHLADYIEHLRKVDQQSNESDVSSQPNKPNQSRICERNPHRICNCPRGVCADDDATYRFARGPYTATGDANGRIRAPKPNEHGNFRCPISGFLCSESVCREWCSG